MEIFVSGVSFLLAAFYFKLNRGVLVNPILIFLVMWGVLFGVYTLRSYWFPDFEFLDVSDISMVHSVHLYMLVLILPLILLLLYD